MSKIILNFCLDVTAKRMVMYVALLQSFENYIFLFHYNLFYSTLYNADVHWLWFKTCCWVANNFFVFNHREYSWCSTCIIFYVETAKSYLEGHGLQCQGNLKANLGVLCFETVAIAQKNKIDAWKVFLQNKEFVLKDDKEFKWIHLHWQILTFSDISTLNRFFPNNCHTYPTLNHILKVLQKTLRICIMAVSNGITGMTF